MVLELLNLHQSVRHNRSRKRPWSRIYIQTTLALKRSVFLEAFSNWSEVFKTPSLIIRLLVEFYRDFFRGYRIGAVNYKIQLDNGRIINIAQAFEFMIPRLNQLLFLTSQITIVQNEPLNHLKMNHKSFKDLMMIGLRIHWTTVW